MSPSDRLLVCLALLSGCAIPLDGEPAAQPGSGDALPVAPSCRLFAGALEPRGAARSLPRPDGASLWLLDGEGERGASTVIVPAGARVDDCLAAAPGPSTPALDDQLKTPMGLFRGEGGARLFFQQLEPAPGEPFGVRTRGIGVASELAAGRFEPNPTLLWTADRPSFGTAAAVKDGQVYAFGCLGAGFLSADCWVARADLASYADASAYSYYEGAGLWTPDPARAWPVARGAGAQIDVAFLEGRDRWLMVYATPLGKTLHVRTGLSPEGPWSDDHEVAACDLGGEADAFCTGVAAHPELLPGERARVAVTYALSSLAPDWPTRLRADPGRLAPKLTVLALPEALP